MKSYPTWLVTLGAILIVSSVGEGALIFDTGIPDQNTNRSIFADPSFGAQFAAQQFVLGSQTQIDTIQAYIGGVSGRTIIMDLASSIGTTATAADLIASFSLPTPGTTPSAGAFVAATVNQVLQPGSYFLVFSADALGGWLPIQAPSTIGTRYLAVDGQPAPFTNVNTSLPISSNFFSTTYQPGIRIFGSTVVSSSVPEPSTLAIFFVLSALSLPVFFRRRKRTV
jgi:hypothetical protein